MPNSCRPVSPTGSPVDKECSVEKAREFLDEPVPLFAACGRYDLLANAMPAEITAKVHRCLDMGFTTVGPPADIYPPARLENITAFVRALKEYNEPKQIQAVPPRRQATGFYQG